jgi:hypothetical protein
VLPVSHLSLRIPFIFSFFFSFLISSNLIRNTNHYKIYKIHLTHLIQIKSPLHIYESHRAHNQIYNHKFARNTSRNSSRMQQIHLHLTSNINKFARTHTLPPHREAERRHGPGLRALPHRQAAPSSATVGLGPHAGRRSAAMCLAFSICQRIKDNAPCMMPYAALSSKTLSAAAVNYIDLFHATRKPAAGNEQASWSDDDPPLHPPRFLRRDERPQCQRSPAPPPATTTTPPPDLPRCPLHFSSVFIRSDCRLGRFGLLAHVHLATVTPELNNRLCRPVGVGKNNCKTMVSRLRYCIPLFHTSQ